MTVRVNQVKIDRLLHSPGGEIGVTLQQVGLDVQSRAKRLCPVDTGRLRSSIQTTKPTHITETKLRIRIGSRVKYAAYVELGTRWVRARPYLRLALAYAFRRL